MKNIILLIKKDILRFFKDKSAVLLTFLVPAVLIVIFGSIWGGGSKNRGKIPIILVNESGIELANFIESEIDSSSSLRSVKYIYDEEGNKKSITEEKAKELVKTGKYPAALVMPADFFSDTSSVLRFKYYYDPRNEIESQLIQGTIQKTVFTKIPKIFPFLLQKQANSFLGDVKADSFKTDIAKTISGYFGVNGDEVVESMSNFDVNELVTTDSGEASAGDFDIINNLVKFDSEQLVGKDVKNPGVTRMVGGWAIMFLLFTLSAISTTIFEEKQEGTLKRLFCMPISRNEYLWAKYIYSILIGVIQLFVLFLFAYFLYDVDIFSNITNLIIVMLISASSAVAFGMIIISLTNSLAQANGIATLFILVMSALGGSWFPVTLFPNWMQVISKLTITYWSVEAFLQVLWRNATLSKIVFPHLIILIGIAIVVNILALHFFKKNQVI